MLTILETTCEYRKDPLGLDERRPRISWKLRSDRRNTLQTSYRLQVANDPYFLEPLWDTGDTASDQSVLVVYEGPELRPRTRYYYRVSARDNHGECSGWSETAFWETGMMDCAEWKADWIMAEEEARLQLDVSPLLRKAFILDGQIASARVYVTALGLYLLDINGKRVSEDCFTPGWTSYRHRQQYQTYDVSPLLQSGENVIGATLGNGWYAGYIAWSGERGFYGKKRALLVQLHIRMADGTEQVICSDESWQSSEGPIRMSEIYHGERYDARLERVGWNMPGYDASEWSGVKQLEYPKDILVAQEALPPRIMDELKPTRLFRTPAGEAVLDFGQNMVGFVRFHVKGNAGDHVVLRHAEVLDRDGNFYTANLKGAKQTIEYILKGGGEELYQPSFTFQGFRYVCIDSYPGKIEPENFTGCVVHSQMKQSGSFACSNELVNQLQHNILWGQKGNFVDVPTDCPQRDERHGWTGDAQMFIRTACFNMDAVLFFRKWLRDLAADQTDEYGVTNVVPNVREVSYAGAAAWGDAAVICPWTLFLCYGDKRVLEEQYDSMKRWVEYIQRQGENPFLWNTGEQFGDWLALDNGQGAWIGRTPTDYISTAFYANSVKLLAKAAKWLEYREEAEKYQRLYESVRSEFRKNFVSPNGLPCADTQTAYVLALMFDLLEEKDRNNATETLVRLLHDNRDHLNTGFVGTPYLCHVLSGFGHHDLACKLLLHTDLPSWLYPVTKGATTIWEHWDGIREDGSFWDDIMNSFNHYSYGSIGDWMYQEIAGIQVDEKIPGYRHILLRPRLANGMRFARAVYESPYGQIVSGWKRNETEIEIAISIPANSFAAVTLPKARISQLRSEGSGEEVIAALARAVQTEDGMALELGSGDYIFQYALDAAL